MSTAKRSRPRFRVGDWVTLQYGTWRRRARIIEDRGVLGAKEGRLYRIRPAEDEDDSNAFEIGEEDLEAAPMPDRAAVLRYLREGGLAAILSANLAGGENQPRAWIALDPRGNVVHTFSGDQGLAGGAPVPFFAMDQGKVLEANKEEVLRFLRTFGLTRKEAEDILREVGTTP